MLSTTEIQAELERVTFLPGWTISAYQGRWEGQHLQITTQVSDANDPANTVTLDVHTFLPPIPDTEYLHTWITWRLARLAVHEVREFYRVDGKPVADPHAPFADRDLWQTERSPD